MDPATYHAWYQSPRGAWIAEQERRLLAALLESRPGETLLDLGCGTGYFSSAFRALGLAVTGLDPDLAVLRFLRARDPAITLVAGAAESLPFADGTFDSAMAVTSLCFVARPERALAELWRVTRRTLVLGLLHRRSLLYLSKCGRGGYRGARWDLAPEVLDWTWDLTPAPRVEMFWAVFLPSAGPLARWTEARLPASLPVGAFLAVALRRPSQNPDLNPA
ncbi:MAG: class I SAM-dependent methyltransferase [Chromatiaceae bacterium]